ncbi:hypothetical protein DXG03_004003 [Asterophora parasitica]|uniref:BTB domain-containing protein n=1 Tax=Asterophora parasitica TaxID=117018 RepID=A0A9P7G4F1_9AGAR|nr:hypothetical protein DXG03_004003 [Asterophora parasitica]
MTSSSSNLDFNNGDVDLILPGRKYRVHKAILSDKSEVFKDLFSIAHSTSPSEEIPAIEMQDDREPFTLFLRLLYDHDLDHYIPKLARGTTNLISRTLDLVDKYSVLQAPMYAKLIPYITRDWPSTLEDWDANEENILQLKVKFEEDPEALDQQLPEPASVIRFAYQYALSEKATQQIPEYLPAAFYHLSRLPPYADDGDPTLNAGDYWDVEGLRTAKRSLLRHQDMICLLHGMDELRLVAARIAVTEFLDRADEEEALEQERCAMQNWWRKVGVAKLLGPHAMPDVLAQCKHLINSLEDGSTEAESEALRQATSRQYRERMQKYLGDMREEIWNSLAINKFSLYAFFY